MLSQQQIQEYHETGSIVVPDMLDTATLARARQVIAEFVAGSVETTEHTEVYDLEPTHTPQSPRVRRIKSPHKNHPLFWEICRDPRLVRILQQLLGHAGKDAAGVRLHGSKINLKAPQYGSPVEWHQDWAFYPHTNDDLLAVGVMLDDMLPENGPLMVVPGSHKGPVFDHHNDEGFFCGAMDPIRGEVDLPKAVTLSGKAGSMSFHHVRAVHGSAQNTSDRPRQLLLYEYANADAWPLLGVKDWAEFNFRLVSGSAGNVPRLSDVPVRLQLPPSPRQGSIYENQTTAKRRFFELNQAAE
jgi:phytanoyl-CoA hydroxylase